MYDTIKKLKSPSNNFINIFLLFYTMKPKQEKTKFTPWEMSEKIELDYSKLVKKFGLSIFGNLSKFPKEFSNNLLFRRKIVFAHRDLSRILKRIKSKKPFIVMTGLMPTGKFHIGHMILVQQLIFYQKLGAKIYIAVADIEAFHIRSQSLEQSKKIALEEYIPNYIALGLSPKNCEIYFQSNRSKETEKSNAYYRLQNLLAKYVTFNEFKAVYGDISPGKILSSLIQASDMLHPQLPEFSGNAKEKPIPVLVPVGADQDPHLRIARDIASRIKNPKFIQLSSSYHIFAPGLNKGKMSASDPNSFISLSDSPDVIKRKIHKYAFSGGRETLKEHRKKGGNPDVDVSYQYLKMFFEPNDKKLAKIYNDYKSGKLLTSQLKNYLIKKINKFLRKHQKKSKKITKKQIGRFFY